MLTRSRISAVAVLVAALLGSGISGCDDDEPQYVTVPSSATAGLGVALPRLLDEGLRVSIREFPPQPCGAGLEGYHVRVQSPRAPARVKRGSVVAVSVSSSPIPSPIVRLNAPEFTTIPDLVGLRYTDAMEKLDGVWVCLDEVPPLKPEASRQGFDAYVVVDQDLDPGLQVPYGGARAKKGGYLVTTLRVRLALREAG